jgi:hypothetical protein
MAMTTKRELNRRERDVQRLALSEQFITERMAIVHDELGLMMRYMDKLVLPRSARRRSARKTFVDRGNVVVFPRGDK